MEEENKMKKGDRVKLIDCSYMIRVDRFTENLYEYNEKDIFEIIDFPIYPELTSRSNKKVHDVFIKNVATGDIYLHSLAFCRPAIIKEIFIGEAEDKLAEYFGCDTVKILILKKGEK